MNIDQNPVDSRLKDSAIKKLAAKDARTDGINDQFASFKAGLGLFAQICSQEKAASVVREFRQWTDLVQKKLVDMAGTVPNNLDFFIKNLDQATNGNLTAALAQYAQQIVALAKEKTAWFERFGPALAANVEAPPKKSAVMLAGLALFLVAVESSLNSRFFAVGNEFGLAGGALFAVAVSLGNVLIPLGLAFLGHRWFYMHDANRAGKISNHSFGIAMIIAFLLWTLVFNILVAEYREHLSEKNLSSESTGQDFTNLHYFLLFALGAAVCGLSFWKAWSFRDPFEKARKCWNDLQNARKNYENDAVIELTNARTTFSEMNTQINRWTVEFPFKFQMTEGDFKRVHGEAITRTEEIFAAYHRIYCLGKVDPKPDFPEVTAETVKALRIGVTEVNWTFFEDRKNAFNARLETATQEWTPAIQQCIEKIAELEEKYGTAIARMLTELEEEGEASKTSEAGASKNDHVVDASGEGRESE